jgi:molybdopterin converting factor small subunit
VAAVIAEGTGTGRTVTDPDTPLVAGDEVAFLPRGDPC